MLPPGTEDIETLSHRTVVELNAESRLAPQRRMATIARRPERAQRLAEEGTGRAHRRQADRASRTDRPDRPLEREMVADAPLTPSTPNQLHGDQRFRADLVAYLDSLPVGELGRAAGGAARSRQEPLGLGVLMVARNERLPDYYKLLPPAGHPGPGESRHCSLRELVADRRAAHAHRRPDGPASGLAE